MKTNPFFPVILATACILGLGACSEFADSLIDSASSSGGVAASDLAASDVDLDASLPASGITSITLADSGSSFSGNGVVISGSVIRLENAGTYLLSGTLSDGRVVVDTTEAGLVRLILAGADISSATGAALQVNQADKVVLTLDSGSTNYLSDGTSYTSDYDSSSDEPNACLFSDTDLTINGSGNLEIRGNFNNGLNSKGILRILDATLTVQATNHGIKATDGVLISSGNLAIQCGGEGVKSDPGSLWIDGGSLLINAGDKGIEAALDLLVSGGSVDIVSSDDGVHSAAGARISGGSLAINAGGQGIKVGDSSTLAVSGDRTVIDITRSTEGIAGYQASISGGTISIVSSDDGFSLSAGTVAGGSESDDGSLLAITGGSIVVESATGDGVDSNGSVTMGGGTLLVHGPVASPEVGMDFNGTWTQTGGVLAVTANYNNMTLAPSTSSTQCCLKVVASTSQTAGTLVHLQNAAGDELLTFKPRKTWQSLVFSSPLLVTGTTCSVYTGGSAGSITADGLASGYTPGTLLGSVTISSIINTLGSGTSTGGSGGGSTPGGGGTMPF